MLGCYSIEEAPVLNQRIAQDFYIADLPRKERVRVALLMREHLYAEAQEDGVDIVFAVHPGNNEQMRAIMRHGQADVVGVLFLHRVRRPAECPQPSPFH